MATILIVDDQALNRQFLATLLAYRGHRLREASCGEEGLALVRAERPDLVIADILMPSMDGYEFVRQVRMDPAIAQTAVIFYSAIYHEREARALAETCGVRHLITKPSEPEVILNTVNEALHLPAAAPAAAAQDFNHRHSRLLADKLSETVEDLRAANARLAALLEISRQLASERDPARLFENLCPAARELLGCRNAGVALFDTAGPAPAVVMDSAAAVGAALLAEVYQARRPLRRGSFLGVPMSTPKATSGVLFFTEKLGGEFSPEDERAAATIAAQAALAHENARQYAQLRTHAAELEAANKDLEAFTYSIAHDLRAPLRHIDAFSNILAQEAASKLGPPEQHHLGHIRGSAQRMAQMIDGLLSLARAGRGELRKAPAPLNPLVEEARRDLEPDLSGRQIEWRIGELPVVECDPALVKQVFVNLLSNAVKFTGPRPRAVIEVGRLPRADPPVVFVRDNGVGFSMKHAGKLFGVFQRLHRQEEFKGTGVGLALVERIVHKHGGRIWAEAAPDQGATFYFTLHPELE